jgi:tetratricopeptide (TPR) repeat protein
MPNFRILKNLGRIHLSVESSYSSMPPETIIGAMRFRFWIVPLLFAWVAAVPGVVPADTNDLPLPRIWNNGEDKKYTPAEFEQLLQQLRSERAGLDAEWKALLKRSAEVAPKGQSDALFQKQLRDMLKRLQDDKSAPPEPLELNQEVIKAGPPVTEKKKSEDPPVGAKEKTPSAPEPVDSLSQAHSLFRSGRYEEALASFRLVDLKGRKAEARAPIQYLMAICHLHLGKPAEALPLFREVANSRGDEKLAAYAQWQLEMHRWERDVRDSIQALRQRRLALGN